MKERKDNHKKYTMEKRSVIKLEKMIGHKFVPISMPEAKVSNEPLHYIRSGVKPIIVDPMILDRIPAPDKTEWSSKMNEFLNLASSDPCQWISKRDQTIFESYMMTNDTNKMTADDLSVSMDIFNEAIRKVKRLIYIHFAEDFGIKTVPERWVSAYVPLYISDETETFIPGRKHRS